MIHHFETRKFQVPPPQTSHSKSHKGTQGHQKKTTHLRVDHKLFVASRHILNSSQLTGCGFLCVNVLVYLCWTCTSEQASVFIHVYFDVPTACFRTVRQPQVGRLILCVICVGESDGCQ